MTLSQSLPPSLRVAAAVTGLLLTQAAYGSDPTAGHLQSDPALPPSAQTATDDSEMDPATDADDWNEILNGFPEKKQQAPTPVPPREDSDWLDQHLQLTGSTSLGVSYNVIPHFATVGPDSDPAAGIPGTYFGNLQRLRARGDLQADLILPFNLRARLQAFGFYDFAFLIHGRDRYTEEVLQDYELQGEILDFWIAGSWGPHLDFKFGRQVVNWGRSDTLRVTDVINALNNREPGLTDIENLRLPSTMARIDAYWKRLSASLLVIPEIRYDYDPPPGNDFYPAFDVRDIPYPPADSPLTRDQLAALLAASAAAAFSQNPPSLRAPQWGAVPELGLSISGIFRGWDLSFYLARLYQNRTTLIINLPSLTEGGLFTDDDLVTLIGAGGNYTWGGWLFKAEAAWIDELDYVYLTPREAWTPSAPIPAYELRRSRFSRLDWMLGVEYYGFSHVMIALELAHRHVFGYESELQYLPNYVYENNVELALRVTSEHFNGRLRPTLLTLLLANERGFAGGTLRLSADYEFAEGLIGTLGYLHFFGSEQLPFNTWDQNNRLFGKLKYSF